MGVEQKSLDTLESSSRRGQCPSADILNPNYSGMLTMSCLMQTVINLMAGIRDTWFQIRMSFTGLSKSIFFLPLPCTDLCLGGERKISR